MRGKVAKIIRSYAARQKMVSGDYRLLKRIYVRSNPKEKAQAMAHMSAIPGAGPHNG